MKVTEKNNQFAVIATDVAVFTLKEGKLSILLIKMTKDPYKKTWALPGGLVDPKESVDDSALRHLIAKTGVKDVYLEQLYTFGNPNRDPFGRVVSVGYMALIPSDNLHLRTTKNYADVSWFPINKLPELAYDHKEIIQTAVERLRAKLGYSNIVYGLLPEKFTLGELQGIYETILRTKFDRRNFRKKILSLGIIKNANEKRRGLANRPAILYSFTKKDPQIIEMI